MFLFDEVEKIAGNFVGETFKFVDFHYSSLLKSIKAVKGNARVMIVSIPFWAIPMTWLGVYQSIFAKSLGVTDTELGFIASLGMLFQIGTTIFGGYVSDRWGRKSTLMFWDTFCFLTAFIFLLFAKNIWFFIGFIIFLNARYVGFPAWKCLCIEGVKPEKRSQIFSLTNLTGAVSSLFVLFAGVFVDKFGIDGGTRIITGFCIIGVTGGLYYRRKYLVDSCDSKLLVEETKNEKSFNVKKYYTDTFKKLYFNKTIFWLLVVQILVVFTFSMWNLYWPIYFTDVKGLGLKLADLPVFSLVSSIVGMTATFLAISLVKQKFYKKILVYSSLLPILGSLIYIIAPPNTMYLLVLSFVINNTFAALYGPISESMTADAMNEKERARLFSMFSTVLYLFCVPSTAIAGILYTIWPRLLFIVICSLTILTFLLIHFKIKYRPKTHKYSR
ncbi:MAG: hypothetical protein A2231_03315 [Candidatus Firestonebacteria bacterium RIFOXYA2_FULL_40_8]|nr:MAG: hypothetical protein A2231_03315 [Candidatus Firestonebacteria bacterium RIFOXYA2_FULL_40_8]